MQLESLNVVAIGGGHGLGKVLSSLAFLENKLTGIVTTTDNGGSTGKLRKRSSTIAWGDLRNCLTELVDENSIGSKLFNFRFDGQDELGGHNLGNLILYGLGQIQSRPIESIKLVRRLLRIKTAVYPMSEDPTDLMAFYPTGRCRVGEMSVDEMPVMPDNLMLAPLVKPPLACLEALQKADVIILGPGSFLTSVVPPLLVRDIANAIKNRTGICLFIDNLVKEKSPVASLNIDEKLTWLENNLDFLPVDYVIAEPGVSSAKVKVINRVLSSEKAPHHHDNEKLIKAIQAAINDVDKNELNIVNS